MPIHLWLLVNSPFMLNVWHKKVQYFSAQLNTSVSVWCTHSTLPKGILNWSLPTRSFLHCSCPCPSKPMYSTVMSAHVMSFLTGQLFCCCPRYLLSEIEEYMGGPATGVHPVRVWQSWPLAYVSGKPAWHQWCRLIRPAELGLHSDQNRATHWFVLILSHQDWYQFRFRTQISSNSDCLYLHCFNVNICSIFE